MSSDAVHPDPSPPEPSPAQPSPAQPMGTLSADEAAYDLELLDYDFYLFRHLSTCQDAVLYRTSVVDYRLETVHPAPPGTGAGAPHLTCSTVAAPRLTTREAVDR